MNWTLLCYFIILMESSHALPNKWGCLQNKCYFADTTESVSMDENIAYCQSNDAKTVSIHSKEENNFLRNKFPSAYGFWLGIKQVDFDAQTYEWLDGSKYNYSNWDPDQSRKRKSCAGASFENGIWIDSYGSDAKRYPFCQFGSSFSVPREFKQMEIPLNETKMRLDEKLETATNKTNALITVLKEQLEENEVNRNNSQMELRNDLNESMSKIQMQNRNAMQMIESKLTVVKQDISNEMNQMKEFLNQTHAELMNNIQNQLRESEMKMKQEMEAARTFQIKELERLLRLLLVLRQNSNNEA